jgi:hypothetical protein
MQLTLILVSLFAATALSMPTNLDKRACTTYTLVSGVSYALLR